MQSIIQVYPQRTTPRGRTRPPEYLRQFHHPPLLSGRRVEVGLTSDPAAAEVYTDAAALDSALLLLRSLDYEPQVQHHVTA